MLNALVESSFYTHIAQFVQEGVPTDRIKGLPVVNKAGKNSLFLLLDVFLDSSSERENMITTLCSVPKTQLIREVGTDGFPEFY